MEVVTDLRTCVVRRVVDQDNTIDFPTLFLQIELPHQAPHEQHERVLVGIRMAESKVNVAFGVQRRDHSE